MDEVTMCCTVLTKYRKKQSSVIINKKISRFSTKLSLTDILNEVIGETEISDSVNKALNRDKFSCKASKSEHDMNPYESEPDEILKTLVEFDKEIKYLSFIIHIEDSETDENNNKSITGVNAFTSMMAFNIGIEKSATVAKFDPHETDRFNEKHRLFNNVCDHLNKENCKFPNTMAKEEVRKELMILTNLFWYLDGNTSKFSDKAAHGLVTSIPERYIA